MEFVSVYVTCPDEASAERVARALLERRLVACANIVPRVRSLYRWQDAIQDEGEVAMLMKTRRELVAEVEAAVRSVHPYEVPCIVALDIVAGHGAYLEWVAKETRGSSGGSSAAPSRS